MAGRAVDLAGARDDGRTVRLCAGLDRVQMLLDGYRVKTLPSRLDARDLVRLAAAGARPAGPPPLPAASGDVIEVERTVNASGNVAKSLAILVQPARSVTTRPSRTWPGPCRDRFAGQLDGVGSASRS